MKYILIFFLFLPAISFAETCKQQFPEPRTQMKYSRMVAYGHCLDAENAALGIVPEPDETLPARMMEERKLQLLQEQNRTLADMRDNELNFQREVIDSLDN
jgi:hypothetical protein